jgi:hypothetical protein
VSWEQFKNLFVRNWKEKFLSLVLAFLFWFMIKGHASRSSLPYGYGSDRYRTPPPVPVVPLRP